MRRDACIPPQPDGNLARVRSRWLEPNPLVETDVTDAHHVGCHVERVQLIDSGVVEAIRLCVMLLHGVHTSAALTARRLLIAGHGSFTVWTLAARGLLTANRIRTCATTCATVKLSLVLLVCGHVHPQGGVREGGIRRAAETRVPLAAARLCIRA